jgi:hypothetical protein
MEVEIKNRNTFLIKKKKKKQKHILKLKGILCNQDRLLHLLVVFFFLYFFFYVRIINLYFSASLLKKAVCGVFIITF